MRVTYLLLFLAVATTATAQESNKFVDEPLPQVWNDGEFFAQTLPPDDYWWTNFEDPVLDSLIVVACESNYSALAAIENIKKAKAAWRIAQGKLLPTAGLELGWQRAKTSGNTAQSLYRESWEGYYSAAASVSWQADVFGALYMRSKAQKMLFMATEEEYRAVMVSLVANVATTYFSLRQAMMQLNVITANVASQREIMEIVASRYESGLASKLDVAQSRSVYYSTLAQIPTMQATIDNYRNTMATLLGIYPQQLAGWPDDEYTLPSFVELVGVGMPAGLLRRRPDIRAAERQIEASAAQLGATRRDWFPQIFINGSIGFASESLKELPRSKSLTWEIAPTIKWAIFSGGERINATREARAALDNQILTYNSTVLTAVQEVESAMSQYRNSVAQIVSLREAVNQNRETLTLSLELYKQGLTEFQTVLDAQRSLLTYQNYLVQAQGGSLIYLVQLYESLGGGW